MAKSWRECVFRVGRSKRLKRGLSELEYTPPKPLSPRYQPWVLSVSFTDGLSHGGERTWWYHALVNGSLQRDMTTFIPLTAPSPL